MEDGRESLNPLDDVKGAAQFLRSSHVEREIAAALAAGARVIEPSESDLRVIAPDELPADSAGQEVAEDNDAPPLEAPTPDVIARRKRHRGY